MSTGHRVGAVRYGLPGLAVGLALAWWGGGQGPTLRAQGAGSSPPEAAGTIAFTTSAAGSPSQMLYLIDTKSQAFAIYRVEPSGSKGSGSSATVKLEAARQYRWDLKLSEFNNQPPEVHDVEAMVKSMAK